MSKIWEPSGGVDDKVLFGMYPEDLDAADRQELYDEEFEEIVRSYAVMATIGRYEQIIDEVIDDETRAQLIAESQAAMEAVSIARTAMDSISQSSTAMDPISQSSTAMDPISASDVAMDAVWESQIARDIVLDVSMAAGKFVASLAGLDGPDYADIDDVANDEEAMDAVSVSAVAMEAVAASSIAMDAVIASDDLALPTIVETETAMNEVSLSDLALDSLWESEVAWGMIRDLSMAVGKFAVGRAGLSGYDYADIDDVASSQTAMDAVSTSETAMDAVSTSETAMDAVSTSETAMDAVSASTLAMDAIWESDLAWNIVADVAMAVGKFVAGRAGLDGSDYADIDDVASSETAMDSVAGSETAMDAVAGSETAMDAVAASTMATSAALLSEYFDSIFSEQVGSERFFDGRTINPNTGNVEGIPYHYEWSDGGSDGDATADIVFSSETPSEFAGGRSLYIDSETSEGSTFANSDESHSDFLLDVTNADDFSVWLYDPDNNEFCIFIDGDKVASGLTPSSWEKHSFDVSSETGEIIIGVGSNNDTTGGEWWFTTPHLEN